LKGNVLHDIDVAYFDTKLYFVLNFLFSLKCTGKTELELTNQHLTHFINQLIHNVKYIELIKHIKIIEAAPTCCGLQRNHHQGATASA